MTATADSPPTGAVRPGFAARIRLWLGPRIGTQIGILAGVGLLLYILGANTVATMDRIGINPGFGFLTRSANFEIGETLITFKAGDTYLYAMFVGLLNTLRVAFLGCLLATLLGVSVGIAGLSRNLLLAGLVRWYIEIIRNTPTLLQLFFWVSLSKAFASPRQAQPVLESIFLTNRGIYLPGVTLAGGSWLTLVLVGVSIAVFVAFILIARRRATLTFLRGLAAFALLAAAVTLAGWLTGVQTALDIPELRGFNIQGGMVLSPEFAALLVGLTVKFSAIIAEIVRAGVESVGQGQWEAARSLGLRRSQIMNLIVVPQALRVITPLITSSYLDLTKDSSLAVAIGYPDLVSVINTTANTTGQSLEALIILIAVFLTINLSVAALMNIYNERVALRGSGGR
ncbi:amino acid ABC transporter permease [Pseudochelatococcus contaminans]|uniref:General L-amino acid transport system permease protein n=1 Tax=Pseudochelatococcus contaminans TaxID=1538103 RepID=A0A7W5Z3L4_9HYPH|nr:ABC transporter permease subunit [Pseudochelatococcus contaminans]MBB3809472.1 general L-amino acid transport system permease protein [Pseudochelatococcus contaminans]